MKRLMHVKFNLHSTLIFFLHPQEMEKLKEELENMNDLMEQKDTLTQKLEVSQKSGTVSIFYPPKNRPTLMN